MEIRLKETATAKERYSSGPHLCRVNGRIETFDTSDPIEIIKQLRERRAKSPALRAKARMRADIAKRG